MGLFRIHKEGSWQIVSHIISKLGEKIYKKYLKINKTKMVSVF